MIFRSIIWCTSSKEPQLVVSAVPSHTELLLPSMSSRLVSSSTLRRYVLRFCAIWYHKILRGPKCYISGDKLWFCSLSIGSWRCRIQSVIFFARAQTLSNLLVPNFKFTIKFHELSFSILYDNVWHSKTATVIILFANVYDLFVTRALKKTHPF